MVSFLSLTTAKVRMFARFQRTKLESVLTATKAHSVPFVLCYLLQQSLSVIIFLSRGEIEENEEDER